MNVKKVALPGSDRKPLKGAKITGAAHRDEKVRISVVTKPGIDDASWNKLHAFAQQHGLRCQPSQGIESLLIFTGSVADVESAFGTRLDNAHHTEHGKFRMRTGHLYVPAELRDKITAVLGLDTRPCARPRPHRRAVAQGFTGPQIAKAYNLPAGDGSGQAIGIIELGGQFRISDYRRYRKNCGLSAGLTPVMVGVAGGKNGPNTGPNGADGEVMLDFEVAGGVAPGALLVGYFAPNTDAGFVEAILAAAHDSKHKLSTISISWGAREDQWTAQAGAAMRQAIQSSVAAGITVCVASGDNGSSDGGTGNGVDLPASIPEALGCGGTALVLNGDGSIARETVWNSNGGATGGGVSTRFAVPSYQAGVKIKGGLLTGRGLPDVAGPADPNTGWYVRVDGTDQVIGGTSAVAPMWAGIVARFNALLAKPLGAPHAVFYAAAGTFNDVTGGNNGAYSAAPGWDACTGLGTPNGAKLLAALKPATAKRRAA